MTHGLNWVRIVTKKKEEEGGGGEKRIRGWKEKKEEEEKKEDEERKEEENEEGEEGKEEDEEGKEEEEDEGGEEVGFGTFHCAVLIDVQATHQLPLFHNRYSLPFYQAVMVVTPAALKTVQVKEECSDFFYRGGLLKLSSASAACLQEKSSYWILGGGGGRSEVWSFLLTPSKPHRYNYQGEKSRCASIRIMLNYHNAQFA